MQNLNLLSEDFDHILNLTEDLWEELRGKNLFVTGGTGFFGCWILESFLWANKKLDLNSSVVILTRNPKAFEEKVPHLAKNSAVSFEVGNVCSFNFPERKFDFIIHAATDVYSQNSHLSTINTIVEGTKRVLEFAKYCQARKVLLTSSGAVYGRQPPSLSHIGEEYIGSPDVMNPNSTYGESKRLAELLAAIYAHENNFEVKIARCFAFVGAYLPLNGHLAIGNFIGDVLNGNKISIKGDGSHIRSYLYAADLAVWLWTILFRGKSAYPYNVGSKRDVSLADVAKIISTLSENKTKVEIAEKRKSEAVLPERYVPDTERAFIDLGLQVRIDLETAVEKTLNYYNYLRSQDH